MTELDRLEKALIADDVAAVKSILDHCPELLSTNQLWNSTTPLGVAARGGRIEVTRYLLAQGADVNAKNVSGTTPLEEAVRGDHVAVVKLLLAVGADINASHPLHAANNRACVELLIASGIDVNSRNGWGGTPLHSAAHRGEAEAALVLIEHGADVNARTERGETPLHTAAEAGKAAVALILLRHRADIKAKDAQGNTPVEVAITKKCYGVVNILDRSRRVAVSCKRCGKRYVLGQNALCITSEELSDMTGSWIPTGSPDLMIGHARGVQDWKLDRDASTILREGPLGWICKRCYKANRWCPGAPKLVGASINAFRALRYIVLRPILRRE